MSAIAKIDLFPPNDYNAIRLRVDKAFSLRRLTAKVTGEIEFIVTLTAAIANGMGVAVLPESAACLLCGIVSGWMSRITTPSISLSLSLNLPARTSLSLQVQAVKELLTLVVSSPAMEKRQWQLVS